MQNWLAQVDMHADRDEGTDKDKEWVDRDWTTQPATTFVEQLLTYQVSSVLDRCRG